MAGLTLAPDRRFHAGHALVALLALAVLLLGVRAFLALAAPPPLLPPAAPAPPGADAAALASDPFHRLRADPAALPVTALPFSLHGVRVESATGRGSAIIAGPDGVQLVREVGDDLGEGAILAGLAIDHVILERGGLREALWLDNAGPRGAGEGLAAIPVDQPAAEPPPMPELARTVEPAGDEGAAMVPAASADPMLP